jgi:hypothetical protein
LLGKTVKRIIVLFLLMAAIFAAGQAAPARSAGGCGPDKVQFNVTTDKHQHPTAKDEPEKAVVYVFSDELHTPNVSYFGGPTARVGLDGTWVGATRGESYFFTAVDPGNHEICTRWQSKLQRFSKLGSAADFAAEAGKIYYFRITVDIRQEREPAIKLEAVDNADGQLQIATRAFSTSRPKN